MTATLAGDMHYGFSGSYGNTLTDGSIMSGNVGEKRKKSLTNGTTADKANRYVQSIGRALADGISETIDLYDLASLDLGTGAGEDQLGLPLAAAELVGIMIAVTSSGAGVALIGGEGTTAAFNSIFNGSDTALVVVAAGGHFQMYNPNDPAYAITDTANHLLKIEADAGNITYDIFLIFRDA